MKDKEKEILEEIFGKAEKKWNCNWMKCVYGMGLAGRGMCAFGDPLDKDCPNWEDEDEFLRNWEKEYKNILGGL